MTINSPANVLGHVPGTVEKAGRRLEKGRAPAMNPEEYHRAKEKNYILSRPVNAVVVDTHRIRIAVTPRFNPISISDITFGRPGSTALAGAGLHALRRLSNTWSGRLRRGLQIDDFAPRLSFSFNAHNDFFEEIGKFRAARKILVSPDDGALWRPGPAVALDAVSHPDGRRFVDRTAAEEQYCPGRDPGAAAVLGGTQSLHTGI